MAKTIPPISAEQIKRAKQAREKSEQAQQEYQNTVRQTGKK